MALEATDIGRPLYEKYGFVKMEDEMELWVSDMGGYKDIAFFHHLMIRKR